MNTKVVTLKEMEVFRDILPEGFIEETRRRKKKLAVNRDEIRHRIDGQQQVSASLAQQFESLSTSFAVNAERYERLHGNTEKAAREFTEVRNELRELSRQLRQSAHLVRQCFSHQE